MTAGGINQVAWSDDATQHATLRDLYAALEAVWTAYFADLDDARREGDFTFTIRDGTTFTVPTEVQRIQLVIPAGYHRGQIALLVDTLGGETVDTDFLYWTLHL